MVFRLDAKLLDNILSREKIICSSSHQIIGTSSQSTISFLCENKGNNKITELRTILQRESQNS